MRQRKPDLEAGGAELLFIAFSPLEALRRFQEEIAPGCLCLHDPERRAYAAYGLARAPARRLLAPGVLLRSLGLLLRGRRAPVSPRDDFAQLGGVFVIDGAGILRLTHRSADPLDVPAADAVVELVYSLRGG